MSFVNGTPYPVVDADNSSTTPLGAGLTFTGTAVEAHPHASIVVAVKADQDGTLYIEFSPDGENWDSSLAFPFASGTREVHRLTVTNRYARVRVTNTSASPQTYMRLQTLLGSYHSLTSALNGVVQQDADTLVVRPMDFNLMVAQNLYQNNQVTIKDGIDADISGGTVPEDIWSVGGTYTGFPTGSVEAGECVVAGSDTGTVYYTYLASSASTDYTAGSVAVAGAGTYPLGHNIWRCNFAYFVASNGTSFNVGLITIRNTVTTANVFTQIPIGYSQSYTSAYTVPAGSVVLIDRVSGSLRGSATATLDGFFWYRPTGESPRLRFPFTLQQGALYFDDVDFLVRIPSGTDMIPRIVSSSGNNISCQFSYRIIKVK